MKKHPFKWLVDRHGDRVQIDIEIAPLLRILWDMRLVTLNSCEDDCGYVWIEFLTAAYASTFLSIIAKHGDVDLRYRAVNTYNICPSDAAHHLANRYHAFLDSWLIAAETWEAIDGGGDVRIRFSVRFPRGHLGRVMDTLIRHAQAQDGTPPCKLVFNKSFAGPKEELSSLPRMPS